VLSGAGGRDGSRAPVVSARGLLGGHSRDSSHHWMPWRICSDFDRPVRAVIDWSLSSTSVSIMNVQRFFLITSPASLLRPAQGTATPVPKQAPRDGRRRLTRRRQSM